MTTKLLYVNNEITLNTDMGFAGRIIGKYCFTGDFFFEGVSLTFLNMQQEGEAMTSEQNPVYLSLKLLIAYNYQQLYNTILSGREVYLNNLEKVLYNQLNQLKIINENDYEYVNRIYQLVLSKQEKPGREKIQQLLEEQLKSLLSGKQMLLNAQQTEAVRQLSHKNLESIETSNATEHFDFERINKIFEDNGVSSYNNYNKNKNINQVEALPTATASRLYFDNHDIFIDLLHKDGQEKSLPKKSYDAILHCLEISGKDRETLGKLIDKQKTSIIHSNTIISRVKEAFLKDTSRGLLNQKILHKEINPLEIEGFVRYITNQDRIVLHKEVFLDYIKNSPVSISNELDGRNNPSNQEIVRMIGIIKTNNHSLYDEILNQNILETEAFYDYKQKADKQKDDKQKDDKLYLDNELIIKDFIKNRRTKSGYFPKLKNVSDRYSLNISNYSVTAEKFLSYYRTNMENGILRNSLAEMVKNGLESVNTERLQRILHFFTEDEINKVQLQTSMAMEAMYQNSTDAFVYLIRNVDTERLNQIIETLREHKAYQSKISELLLTRVGKDNHSELKEGNSILFRDITTSSKETSSIRLYQEHLMEKHLLKESKDRLVNTLLKSSQAEKLQITRLIKNIFTKEELKELLSKKTKDAIDKLQSSQMLEELTSIIRNTNHRQFDRLLQSVQTEEVLNNITIQEIIDRKLQKELLLRNRFNRNNGRIVTLGRNHILSISAYRQKVAERGRDADLKKSLESLLSESQPKVLQQIHNELNKAFSKEEKENAFQDFRESNGNFANLSTGELIYFIKTADPDRLTRIIEVIKTNPVLSRKIDQMLENAENKIKLSTDLIQEKTSVFESSIVNNKLQFEQSHKITEMITRQHLLDIIDNGSIHLKNSLVEFAEQSDLMINARKIKANIGTSNQDEETNKEIIRNVIREAAPIELEEFIKAFKTDLIRKEVARDKSRLQTESQQRSNITLLNELNERNELIQQTELPQQNLKLEGMQELILHLDKLDQDKLNQDILNQEKLKLDKLNQDKLKQDNSNQDELHSENTNRNHFITSDLELANLEHLNLHKDGIQTENAWQTELMQRLLHEQNTVRTLLHQDILKKNLLLQKTLINNEKEEGILRLEGVPSQEISVLNNPVNTFTDNLYRHKKERNEAATQEKVKKIVDEYIITEQTQINYSHNRNTETLNELKVQKKEIRKLKENLSIQHKAVEDLKKQIAAEKNSLTKVDINQVTKDIMKTMQQQIMVARLRKGLD